MSESRGCLGCLGNLIFITLIGGLLFGGLRCSISLGGLRLGFGSGIAPDENVVNLTELEPQKKIVEESVKIFNAQLNQGKCDAINQQSSQIFRQNARQLGVANWCEKLRQELGTVESSELLDWNGKNAGNFNNASDYYILVLYNTHFSKLSAPVKTVFTWRVQNGKAELYGYHIDPADLPQNSNAMPNPI
jgi:hypothetical protein